MTQGDRLKEVIRLMFGDNQSGFARQMGVSPQALYPYLADVRRIGSVWRDRLLSVGINPDWVDSGRGDMVIKKDIVSKDNGEYDTNVLHSLNIRNNNETRIVMMQPLKDQTLIMKYFPYPVGAGFQPAEDSEPYDVDFISLMSYNKDKSFIAEITGNSMTEFGIDPGDYIVINPAFIPEDDDIVVAALNGDLIVKHFKIINKERWLISGNKAVLPIKINGGDNVKIFGVVETINKKTRKRDRYK